MWLQVFKIANMWWWWWWWWFSKKWMWERGERELIIWEIIINCDVSVWGRGNDNGMINPSSFMSEIAAVTPSPNSIILRQSLVINFYLYAPHLWEIHSFFHTTSMCTHTAHRSTPSSTPLTWYSDSHSDTYSVPAFMHLASKKKHNQKYSSAMSIQLSKKNIRFESHATMSYYAQLWEFFRAMHYSMYTHCPR
jgi:hypothetical protein